MILQNKIDWISCSVIKKILIRNVINSETEGALTDFFVVTLSIFEIEKVDEPHFLLLSSKLR